MAAKNKTESKHNVRLTMGVALELQINPKNK